MAMTIEYTKKQLKEANTKAWRIMHFLALYRLSLAILLIVFIVAGTLPDPLGQTHLLLFNMAVLAYVLTCLLSLYPLLLKTPSCTVQVYLLTSADIILFILMMHASGGISSGVGMLLVVSIANASMLLAGRMSVFFAALASLAVLSEQLYSQIYDHSDLYNYSMAGLLGLALIVTSALATVLARQARENADLAHARGLDLANMSELTEQVISQMAIGVLVVDQQLNVRLINAAARRLIDAPSQKMGASLHAFSEVLSIQLQQWNQEKGAPAEKRRIDSIVSSVLVQIVRIRSGGDARKAGVLIFIEDANEVDQQFQQLRLAALGRLTAGIAHEIRNPLSSIRHASALLAEAEHLAPEDQRLTDIIQENTARVNRIVEDVLQLGNRDRVNREQIELTVWLKRFVEEIEFLCPEITPMFECELDSYQSVYVWIDAGHLHQILSNLLSNAANFARQSIDTPKVILRLSGSQGQPAYIEMINNGPPVDAEYRDRLFEPFFTTSTKGSGLGLYLSRELAHANQCHLAHQQLQQYTCFRLSFNAQAKQEEDDQSQ